MAAIASCACGARWVQHGNASGHCAGCHRTFYGVEAFDRHQHTGEDGRPVCSDPATAPPTKAGSVFWADHEGQWHFGEFVAADAYRARITAMSERLASVRPGRPA